MSGPFRVGCCNEIPEPNWRWVADALSPPLALDWSFFSTAPHSAAERLVQRPRLSRYRACRQLAAGTVAGRFDLIFTHHPLVTCWTELFCQGRRLCPHVAFAFNFTRLPRQLRLAVMRRAFATVDRFVVFSTFERELYSRHFQIPLAKFEMIPWGIREPAIVSTMNPAASGEPAHSDTICAVGTQARDYATLLEAMRRLPHIHLVLVASPKSVRGLPVPSNVTVRFNIPRFEAEAVIRDARLLVLPLLHAKVPCGHVTLVTAMFLSRAIVATRSAGISDYLIPDHNGVVVPPSDPAALAAAIDKLWNDPDATRRLGQNGRAFALANCTEERTIAYVRGLIERLRMERPSVGQQELDQRL
jgi:glycosyltransferase involved in cell wall biosynthesis